MQRQPRCFMELKNINIELRRFSLVQRTTTMVYMSVNTPDGTIVDYCVCVRVCVYVHSFDLSPPWNNNKTPFFVATHKGGSVRSRGLTLTA